MASPRSAIHVRRWRQGLRAVFAVFLVFSELSLRGADTWHYIETPRFTVVSQLGERDTRAWADEFNEYIEALKKIVRVDDQLLPKLTVVFFARDKAFRPYLPVRPDGKPWQVAAYFNRRETWAVIGMAEGYNEEGTRRTIFHEGVHWLVSTFTGYQTPLWLNEGLAEVFSTFTVEKHKARWGDPIAYHILRLRNETNMPIGLLLAVQHDNKLFNEDNRVSIFYAQSWAFVHFLLFGEKKGEHATFTDFLNATLSGLSPNQAFKKCFGVDSDGMDLQLSRYMRTGSYFVGSTPLVDSSKTTSPFVVAPPDFVEIALARLALSTGHSELARQHADAAVTLAPQSPAGYDMLAAISQDAKDSAGALAASQKADELKTKDAWTLFILAYNKWLAAIALGGVPPAEARVIANLYERAINLYPNFKYAFLNLAGVLSAVEKIGDNDEKFILYGQEKFPGEGMLMVGLAELARKRGKKDEAQQMLTDALAHPGELKREQLEGIKRRQIQWLFLDGWSAAEALSNKHKFSEALAVMVDLEKQELPLDLRGQAQMQHRMLATFVKMQAAEDAFASGKKDEARQLYAELLEMPAANASMRRRAEEMLRKLGNKRPPVVHPVDTSHSTATESAAPTTGDSGK